MDRKRGAIFTLSLLSFLFLASSVRADVLTGCQWIGVSGGYELNGPIYAGPGSALDPTVCVLITADNVVLDLGGYTIQGGNATVGWGLLIEGSNVTVQRGTIKNFLVGTQISDASGGVVENLNFLDMKIWNNTANVNIINVDRSHFYFSAIDPVHDSAISVYNATNSNFFIQAQSKTFAARFTNITNVTISGRFDSFIASYTNITTGLGFQWAWPPIVTSTTTITYYYPGIALDIRNATNVTVHDTVATAQTQGIAVWDSDHMRLMRITLPASSNLPAVFGLAGYEPNQNNDVLGIPGNFGGIYLSRNSYYVSMCEVSGALFDDCDQAISQLQSCPEKNNSYYTSCDIIGSQGFAAAGTIPNFFLTPLAIISTTYPFVNFMITPFFLSLMFAMGASIYISVHTKMIYGFYMFLALVGIIGMVEITMWFTVVFLLLMMIGITSVFGGRK